MASVAAIVAKDQAASLGLGTNKNPKKYLNQDFEELRARCLAARSLFEDPTFPAAQSSLGNNELGPDSDIVQGLEWKRPKEINPNPQFITEVVCRDDVLQGMLGDCWFICSIASLTLNKECLYRVIPKEQNFDTNYAGIFHFKFWQYGEWVDVVVDDRLPYKNGKLVFDKSATRNVFWSALLEKAYAKLNGTYEALSGGISLEALEDFTGGIGEFYFSFNPPQNLFEIIQNSLKRGSLVACATQSATGKEDIDRHNVVKNHAYTLSGAEEVSYRGEKVQLVRVRNPWGCKEWNGPWSDKSPEWDEVDKTVRDSLRVVAEDGETWIPLPSFLIEYCRVDICHLHPDDICSSENLTWSLSEFSGSWKFGSTAGGCTNYPTFWTNPQFHITLEEPDVDQPDGAETPLSTVIVSLMQKDGRRKKIYGEKSLSIGFTIYEAPKEMPHNFHLGHEFFMKYRAVAHTDSFINLREVFGRFQLPIGNYVIVPSTFEPFKEGEFLLRVYTEKKAKALELGYEVHAAIYEPAINANPDAAILNGAAPSHEEKDEFTARDLRDVLNDLLSKREEVKSEGFSLKTCKEMIDSLDEQNTGTLGKVEFKKLCKKLQFYGRLFVEVDANVSGNIDAHEMRNALHKAGFNLSNRIHDVIIRRYITGNRAINFEDFIACMMRLETLFKMFNILDTDKDGKISLTLSEWVCAGLI
ncbi:calpain-8-like [Engystomops pustulosus]|uniref:calpain-8-like n=1 Tax=Engystomops pustulosus TaxID=76066 RepID=UPI003AFA26A4